MIFKSHRTTPPSAMNLKPITYYRLRANFMHWRLKLTSEVWQEAVSLNLRFQFEKKIVRRDLIME